MSSPERSPIVRLAPAKQKPLLKPLRLPVFVEEVQDEHLFPHRLASGRASGASRMIVALLIPLLTLQPFVRVYAEEVDAMPQEPIQSPTEEGQSFSPAVETEIVDALLAGEEITTPDPWNGAEEETPSSDSPADEQLIPPGSGTEDASTSPEVGGGVGADTDADTQDPENIPVLPADTSTSTDATTTEALSPTPPEDSVATGTEPVVESQTPDDTQEQPSEEISDVTFPDGPSQEEPSVIDSAIAEREERLRIELRAEIEREFTRGCMTLDGVGYYCIKPEEVRSLENLRPSASVSSVTSEIDPTGTDKEIFAVYAGERTQLTANDTEDAFPSKDLAGRSVVWQGQRDGRWQIFFASFASGTPKILQLTNGAENNFNPRVEGESIVWQSWFDGNWDIVLAKPHRGEPRRADDLPEVNRTLGINPDWDVTRVSMNPEHDMFPALAGGIVTWQRAENGGWSVYAYSPETNVETRVSEPGRKSENARFTLVYEVEGDEGERRMIGYDVATGERIDLTEEARRVSSGNAPYVPEVPVDGTDQAALPAQTGSSARALEEQGGDTEPPATDL